jgi:hypothetical protein
MRISLRCLVVAVAAGLTVAADARAQGGPTAEGAIGYAFLHDNSNDVNAPIGWMASVGGNLTRWLALVGEVGGNYKTWESGAAELTLNLHTFTAGPRLMVTSSSPVAPFAQILFGVAHASVDVGVPSASIVLRGSSFVSQFGFGLDFNASPQRALRLEVDVRQLRDDRRRADQWRLVGAFVFRN